MDFYAMPLSVSCIAKSIAAFNCMRQSGLWLCGHLSDRVSFPLRNWRSRPRRKHNFTCEICLHDTTSYAFESLLDGDAWCLRGWLRALPNKLISDGSPRYTSFVSCIAKSQHCDNTILALVLRTFFRLSFPFRNRLRSSRWKLITCL